LSLRAAVFHSSGGPVTDLDTPAVTCAWTSWAQHRRVHDHLAATRGQPAAREDAQDSRLGRMQMAAGAQGITCQKLGEVRCSPRPGVADDVLLTSTSSGRAKIERLLALARRLELAGRRVRQRGRRRGLGEAARAAGTEIPSSSSATAAFGRNGVQTRSPLDLARTACDWAACASGPHDLSNREPGTRQFSSARSSCSSARSVTGRVRRTCVATGTVGDVPRDLRRPREHPSCRAARAGW